MVRGNMTPIAPGMCFSDEPMICIYGEFGVRLEDIIYMGRGRRPLVHRALPLRPRPVRSIRMTQFLFTGGQVLGSRGTKARATAWMCWSRAPLSARCRTARSPSATAERIDLRRPRADARA